MRIGTIATIVIHSLTRARALRSALFVLITLGGGTSSGSVPLAAEGNAWLAQLEERFADDWRRYRLRYVAPEGRVIDTGNGNVSHSEGQGYALLFALAADDRVTFDRIRNWTERSLARDDGLHYWRYDPSSEPPVGDHSAAADGDLLIAWALLRAAQVWGEESHLASSRRIVAALEARLVRKVGHRLLIVPWDGADLETPRVINPSYFVFPAMQDIAVLTRSPVWIELYEDCLDLVRQARFGRWQLPPDWLAIDDDNRFDLWRERNPYFSFDAIRIPLHLVWAGHASAEVLEPYLRSWRTFRGARVPMWFDLRSGEAAHASHMGPAGFTAVRAVTESLFRAAQDPTASPAQLPDVYGAEDYFSASLILLSRLAEIDARRAQKPTATPTSQAAQTLLNERALHTRHHLSIDAFVSEH